MAPLAEDLQIQCVAWLAVCCVEPRKQEASLRRHFGFCTGQRWGRRRALTSCGRRRQVVLIHVHVQGDKGHRHRGCNAATELVPFACRNLQVGAVLGRDESARESKTQELLKLLSLTHPSAAFFVVGACGAYTSQAGFPQKDRIRYPWEIWLFAFQQSAPAARQLAPHRWQGCL